jgi:hypothetical protein
MLLEEKRNALLLFPTALEEYILPKLHELRERAAHLRARTLLALERADEFPDSWFIREVIKASIVKDVQETEQEIRELRGYLPGRKQRPGSVTDETIGRAKEYSIVDIAHRGGLKLKKSGDKFFVVCPFHKEKSASLCIYPETQSFYCFGCSRSGDVITFAQALLGLSFIEAVKELTA